MRLGRASYAPVCTLLYLFRGSHRGGDCKPTQDLPKLKVKHFNKVCVAGVSKTCLWEVKLVDVESRVISD